MRETSAVWFTKLLWASSSGDRLLVALPYKWDMSQAKVHASNHLFKPNALLQFFERTWHQSLFLDKGFHTCLGACTPVAFVTMPAGSSDSLCYDLRHNMSFDDRIQFPPWCSRVPNTMVPLFLAGVDLNTFGFRRVFSFISPCHWRYCPLPQRRGLASAQNHEFTTQSETRFIFQLHFVTTIPSLTHFNGKRFLLRPVFLFIVFIGLFGLVLLRIFPFSSRGRILLFHMCFGIRISSPFHLATQTTPF